MAYPTVNKPYGLKPINLIGGQVYAGSTRELAITTSSVNSASPIYYGGLVQLDSTGVVIPSTLVGQTSAVAGVVGVFVGCSYTNPTTGQKLFAQYWPGFASGVTDAIAYVVDDPDALFKVVSVGSTADTTGLVPAAVGQTAVGCNCVLVANSPNTTSGDAQTGVYINNVTTALPFRVVDVVPDTATSSGYVEVIVKLNFGYHSYNNVLGV